MKILNIENHKPVPKSIVNTLATAEGGRLGKRFFVRITECVIVVLSVLFLIAVIAIIVTIVHFATGVERFVILFLVVKSVLTFQVLLTQLPDDSRIRCIETVVCC